MLHTRRVAIVGTGFVGSTTASAWLMSALNAEVVLIDRDRRWKKTTKMLSMKWKKDRENHLVSLWLETGERGRVRRDGKRKSGLKHMRLPQTAILGKGR